MHAISALLLKGPFDAKRARELHLHAIELPQGLTLFPLSNALVAGWTEEFHLPGARATSPAFDAPAVRKVASVIAHEPLYAIVETEYFGGAGEQAAVVYRGDALVMPASCDESGPINAALEALGVVAVGMDAFDAIGLGKYRSWETFSVPS